MIFSILFRRRARPAAQLYVRHDGMRGVTLRGGRAQYGGAIFVHAGGSVDAEDVVIEGSAAVAPWATHNWNFRAVQNAGNLNLTRNQLRQALSAAPTA